MFMVNKNSKSYFAMQKKKPIMYLFLICYLVNFKYIYIKCKIEHHNTAKINVKYVRIHIKMI